MVAAFQWTWTKATSTATTWTGRSRSNQLRRDGCTDFGTEYFRNTTNTCNTNTHSSNTDTSSSFTTRKNIRSTANSNTTNSNTQRVNFVNDNRSNNRGLEPTKSSSEEAEDHVRSKTSWWWVWPSLPPQMRTRQSVFATFWLFFVSPFEHSDDNSNN